jgi:hypothetical protein
MMRVANSVGGISKWDSPQTHLHLARLTNERGRFRLLRMLSRLRSPRRLIATTLAVIFFSIYVSSGIMVLSTRTPTDPARLQLWLSGGMVIYLLYHSVRCVWSNKIADLEMTPAEDLWLGGGPLRRSSLAVYHINNVLIAAMMKTVLLAVVLACDVRYLSLLLVGIFSSLVLLEIARLTVQRWSAGLSSSARNKLRFGITAIAVAMVLQVLARVFAAIPSGSATSKYLFSFFESIGSVAGSEAVQWLALPWNASSHLAVTANWNGVTLLQFMISIAMVPISIMSLVRVDAWSRRARHAQEQARLAAGDYLAIREQHSNRILSRDTPLSWLSESVGQLAPRLLSDAIHLAARQSVSVRRYAGTLVFSFVVPTLLCLSPLVTGQVTQQWLYVVGGIAMCTMLLAPPALRIDFRRDLKRMQLLRALPVRPLSMVLGQITLPLLITFTFQWTTIIVAAIVTRSGWGQTILWTGTLTALAVFTFAIENALFLAYPHHERAEGIGMMVRAKLSFLGKISVIAGSLTAMVIWAALCKNALPDVFVQPAFISGALVASWAVAVLAIAITTWCWRRFDLSYDVPPE